MYFITMNCDLNNLKRKPISHMRNLSLCRMCPKLQIFEA